MTADIVLPFFKLLIRTGQLSDIDNIQSNHIKHILNAHCLLIFSCFSSELVMAQRKFAHCLGEFQFEYVGDAKTDDEKCIGECGFFTIPFD